jgi:hypothetical protein
MFNFDDFNRASARTEHGTAVAYLRGSVVSLDLYPRDAAAPYVVSTTAPVLTTPEAAAVDAYEWACEQLASERVLQTMDEVMA